MTMEQYLEKGEIMDNIFNGLLAIHKEIELMKKENDNIIGRFRIKRIIPNKIKAIKKSFDMFIDSNNMDYTLALEFFYFVQNVTDNNTKGLSILKYTYDGSYIDSITMESNKTICIIGTHINFDNSIRRDILARFHGTEEIELHVKTHNPNSETNTAIMTTEWGSIKDPYVKKCMKDMILGFVHCYLDTY